MKWKLVLVLEQNGTYLTEPSPLKVTVWELLNMLLYGDLECNTPQQEWELDNYPDILPSCPAQLLRKLQCESQTSVWTHYSDLKHDTLQQDWEPDKRPDTPSSFPAQLHRKSQHKSQTSIWTHHGNLKHDTSQQEWELDKCLNTPPSCPAYSSESCNMRARQVSGHITATLNVTPQSKSESRTSVQTHHWAAQPNCPGSCNVRARQVSGHTTVTSNMTPPSKSEGWTSIWTHH